MDDVMDLPDEQIETQDGQTLEAPEPAVSISDHAKQFGPGRTETPVETSPDGDQPASSDQPHHAAMQKRQDDGKFDKGKVRHRAKSQELTQRIPELTRLRRQAEAERDQLRAELEQLRAGGQAPSPAAPVRQPEPQTPASSVPGFTDPEPTPEDPAFDGDWEKYVRAAARWDAKKALYEERASAQQAAVQARQQAAQREQLQTFAGRVDTSKAVYPDLEDVLSEMPILPPMADAFVMSDESGVDVLYYLGKNRQELQRILSLAPMPQLKALSLLSQRVTTASSSSPAALTGSAAGRPKTPVVLPPTPPNPVRTEGHRASGTPPKMDGSLSIAEHRRAFGASRR